MRGMLALACAVLLLAFAGCSGSDESARGPLILAPASLQESLEAATAEWISRGHDRPVLSFAGTSALARQITAGAPGDVFISADDAWMDEVEQRGLVAPGTREVLLANRLVLVAPAGREARVDIAAGFDLLAMLGGGRLAMADPNAVPAGRYGKRALQTLGVWEGVSDRIASAENVRAALALVTSGEAPLGIVYATDALAQPEVQVIGRFPEHGHGPIAYPIARLALSAHPEAEAFRAYLLSDEGQAIFRRFGFVTD